MADAGERPRPGSRSAVRDPVVGEIPLDGVAIAEDERRRTEGRAAREAALQVVLTRRDVAYFEAGPTGGGHRPESAGWTGRRGERYDHSDVSGNEVVDHDRRGRFGAGAGAAGLRQRAAPARQNCCGEDRTPPEAGFEWLRGRGSHAILLRLWVRLGVASSFFNTPESWASVQYASATPLNALSCNDFTAPTRVATTRRNR